jgi:hypothetical protein
MGCQSIQETSVSGVVNEVVGDVSTRPAEFGEGGEHGFNGGLVHLEV